MQCMDGYLRWDCVDCLIATLFRSIDEHSAAFFEHPCQLNHDFGQMTSIGFVLMTLCTHHKKGKFRTHCTGHCSTAPSISLSYDRLQVTNVAVVTTRTRELDNGEHFQVSFDMMM